MAVNESNLSIDKVSSVQIKYRRRLILTADYVVTNMSDFGKTPQKHIVIPQISLSHFNSLTTVIHLTLSGISILETF